MHRVSRVLRQILGAKACQLPLEGLLTATAGSRWKKMGDVYPTEWLDMQAMIALANSLAK